jgi:hypothetical protein
MRLIMLLLLIAQVAFGQAGQLTLFSFQNSTCEPLRETYQIRTRIISKELTGDVLKVRIGGVAHCCVTFLPVMSFEKGVLNLDFEETGSICECGCCYEFFYEIKGVKDANLQITFRGKEIEVSDEKYMTFPVVFKLLHGDTVNYINKYGLRQGKWFVPGDSLGKEMYLEYAEDRAVRRVELYPNGQIRRDQIADKIPVTLEGNTYFEYAEFNRPVEYYESGVKKRVCYNGEISWSNYYKLGKCQEWNEQGELVYEGAYRQ